MKIKILLLYSALFTALRMLVGSTSLIYILNNGFLEKNITLLKSLQFIIILLTDIPLSYLSDKKSKKLTVLLAIFFSSIWLFIAGFIYSNQNIYIAEIFNALSLTFWGGSFIALLIENYLKDVEIKDTTLIIAKNRKLSSIAIFISIIISSVVPIKDIAIIWKISSILMFSLFILGLFIINDSKTNKTNKKSLKNDIYIIKNLFHNTDFLFLFLLNILILCSFNILAQYTQIVLKNNMLPFPPYFSKSAFIYSMYLMIIIALQIFVSKKMETHKSRNITIYYLAMVLLVSVLFFNNKYLSLLSWMLLFGVQTSILIYIGGKIHNKIDNSVRATLDSLGSSMSNLIAFISIIIIHNKYENIKTIYLYALIICIIQILIHMIQKRVYVADDGTRTS